MQTLIVIVIVAAATAYAVWRLWRLLHSNDGGCSCQGGGCPHTSGQCRCHGPLLPDIGEGNKDNRDNKATKGKKR